MALAAAVAFVIVERTAENPVVPFHLFRDRNRLVTFSAILLAGGVMFSLTVCIGLYVQDILGYSARAGMQISSIRHRDENRPRCPRSWCPGFRHGC